jgi:uncharacterized metal-binding protein
VRDSLYCHLFNITPIKEKSPQLKKKSESFMVVFAGLIYNYVEIYSHCVLDVINSHYLSIHFAGTCVFGRTQQNIF